MDYNTCRMQINLHNFDIFNYEHQIPFKTLSTAEKHCLFMAKGLFPLGKHFPASSTV